MGWVYYIACPETMRVKIGFTTANPYDRLKTLQTGSATKLAMIAMQQGSAADERYLHNTFAEHRLHGEWFKMSEDLFDHISMVTLLEAMRRKDRDESFPRWVEVGIASLRESGWLPDDFAHLIE